MNSEIFFSKISVFLSKITLIFILLFSLFFLSPPSIYAIASYSWSSHAITGGYNWYAVTSSSDGTKLAAVVDGGYIYTSDDSGVTWTERTSAGSRDWASITSSSDGTKLAAAVDYGYIYTSDDSGVTWTERTSAGSKGWTGIASSSDGVNLTATVYGEYIYTSADSGATWAQKTGPGLGYFWKAVASSADGAKLAIVNNSNGHIHTSTDYGATWYSRASSKMWWSITSSSDGVNLAAVVYGEYIYTSANSGVNWTARTGPGSGQWYSIASSSDGTKLAAVGSGYIYTSANSGVNWTQQTSGGSKAWSAVASSSDGTKLVATVRGGHIYTSSDSGVTWTERAITGSKNLYSITSSSDGVKLAAVVDGGYIYTSADSGSTWTERNTTNNTKNYRSIASSSDGTKLVAVASSSYIYTSTNSGASWTQRASSKNWRSVTSSSDGTKLATVVYNGDIYTSANSGVGWTDQTGSGTKNWTSIASSSDGTKLAATVSNGYIYTSTDSGVTWTEQTNSGSKNWSAITSSSDGTILAAAVDSGYIYTSTDSGVTWTEQTNSGSKNWYSVISSSDGTKIIAVTNGGYMYISYDYGVSWNQETDAGAKNWYSVTSSSDGHKLAAVVYGDFVYTGQITNTAPTLTGISDSPDPIKGGNTITIIPSGQGDSESDALYFYCNESGLATSVTTLCSQGSSSVSSPYSSMACNYAVDSGDTTKTIYCRTFDGVDYGSQQTSTYTVDSTPPSTPIAFPTADTYTEVQTVTLSAAGSSAIYYTTNGEIPTTDSTLYTDGIAVNTSQTIKALAVDAVGNQSSVLTATYVINLDSDNPVINDVSSTLTGDLVTITWTTNEDSSSQVEYGLTSVYGTTTPETDTLTRVSIHTVNLNNLVSCAKYYYRVKSKDATGNQGVSAQSVFYTTGCETSSVTVGTGSCVTTTGGTVSLNTDKGSATITAPESYYSEDLSLQINKLDITNSPTAPSGKSLIEDNFFNLSAIDSGGTEIETFDSPVSFVIDYGSEAESSYVESSLDVYKYVNGLWEAKNCTIDTDVNILTCSLPSFSVYSIFGEAIANDSNNNTNSNSSSPSSASVCGDSPPTLIPDLFQINTSLNTAKLFFTPIDVNQFFVSFSTNPNAEENGELVTLAREGVQSHNIYFLKPNTTYYIKVRGQNGCMPGPWSNIMEFTTDNSIYYEYYPKSASITKTTSISKTTTLIPTSTISIKSSPTPIPVSQSSPETKSKHCFLWWCW